MTDTNPTHRPEIPPDQLRCQYRSAADRQCRLLRADTHPSLCAFHAHEEQQLLEPERVGAELASLSGEFKTVNDLNHVLGKLFTLKAQNRISARDAAVLAYIAQLLMQSLGGVKDEILLSRGQRAWERILLRAMEQAFPKPT